ncbi:MAG: MBL fold metallo-hydrolase [Solobacterium sp.]|nr:MBL fold metallo-hydrolase [Solobacterium sp.]
MKIQQIRNATVKIQYGNTVFLVDPWLQEKGTGFSARAVRPEMQGVHTPLCELPFSASQILDGVDHALVTHVHPDHFTADYIPQDLSILAQNEKDKEKITAMGFSSVECFGHETMQIGDITIYKVHARHGDNDYTAEHMGEASGYVLTCPYEETLYIAGDTVYCSSVHDVIERFHPVVIIVNCCEARVPYGRLIMDLEDLHHVCSDAPYACVIASHLDNVNHAMITRNDVHAYVQQNDLKQVWIPEDGEERIFVHTV